MTSTITPSGNRGRTQRRTATGLPNPQPIIRVMPSIYQDGGFLEQFSGGLDAVLAPIYATLDCLSSYVDPSVAPADFLEWLGTWVGLRLEEDWTLERRRHLVANAAELFAGRGTVAGLEAEIELYTGGSATITEPGGVWASGLPTDAATRQARSSGDRAVTVTVDVPDAATVNWPALQVLIRDAIPAHLPVEIELRETSAAAPRRGKARPKTPPATE